MKVNVENISSINRLVKVNLAWEELAERYQKIFERLRKNFKLDGFRPGKVPPGMAKRYLEPQLKYDFMNEVVETSYVKALQEAGIKEHLNLEVKDVDFQENEALDYSMAVEVDPEIQLFDYQKGFPLTKTEYIVKKEDFDLYLEELRERHAEVKEVSAPAAKGHLIECDLQETDATGVPIIGERLQDRLIKIGDGVFGQPGAAGLEGAKVGDQIWIHISNEQDERKYYLVDIKRVEEHILPELTDDWVKQNFKTLENLEMLRKNVKDSLQHEWDHRAETQVSRAIVDYFIAKIDFEVPQTRIERFIENMIENARKDKRQADVDETKLREQYFPVAQREIRWFLIESALIKTEGLKVSTEEIEAQIQTISQAYPEQEREKVINFYKKPTQRKNLESEILEKKVFDKLLQYAKIKTDKVAVSSLRKAKIV
jgi:trigger factor